MDIQSQFFDIFNCIKQKLTPEQLSELINTQDEEGNSVLHYASFKGNFDILLELIANGADIDMRNYMGLSVMHMAAQGDRPNILIYFKDKYKKDIIDCDYNGNTPLHWACHTTAENSINFLLSWMTDVNIRDKKGQTPLHISIHTFRPKIIKKLLSKGADINLKDFSGQSVLSIVTQNKNQSPDFENVLSIITDTKHMKICFQDRKNKNIFNSNLFIFLHLVCEAVIYFILLSYLQSFYINIIFYIIFGFLIISFLLAHLKNPGIVVCNEKRSWLQLVESKVYISDYCPYCKVQKTVMIKHCHLCHKCVNGFDHHCNWIDNCVGANNGGTFIFFILVVLLNLGFSYYVALITFLMKETSTSSLEDQGLHLFNFGYLAKYNPKDMMSAFIMTICIFFFIPVCYVLWTQIKNRFYTKKKIKSK